MSEPTRGALSRLRRRVSVQVGRLIRVGLAAQTLSSSGGSYLAVSRLIASGVALASQLQRGMIVRVVGAPLVRRRPRRGARAAEEGAEPAGGQLEAATDREATEWQDVEPSPLSLVEIDSQPFSLAKSLPSAVAAQQSTFRALYSVTSALARVVSGTTPAAVESRSSPSDTSLTDVQRGASGTLPDDQGTAFADVRALALSSGLMTAGSALLFNLGSAVSGSTEVVLGAQAAGASFSPASSRPANEGTSFTSSALSPTAPSLLQPSVTGSVDSSFQQQSPTLGLPATPSGGTAGTTAALPVTREATGQSELSAQVGGAVGQAAPGGQTATSASGATADLNAGPYAVPNGFNSAFSTPAFAAGSQLSMAVRSLAAAPSSEQLPLRSSQETASAPGGGLPVVPEQYPSSYPVGDAYAVSRITASLGLGGSGGASPPEATPSGSGITEEEAPGLENPSQISGGAFLGAPLEARQGGSTAAFAQDADAGEGRLSLDAQLGAEAATEPARTEGAPVPATRAGLQARQVFGGRWLASIATAAGMGAAMMDLLTGAGAYGLASPSRGVLVDASGARPDAAPSQSLARPPLEATRGVRAIQPASQAFAYARGLSAYQGAAPASRSAWELATVLPGILTPLHFELRAGTSGPLAAPGAATGETPTAAIEAAELSGLPAERPGLLDLQKGSSRGFGLAPGGTGTLGEAAQASRSASPDALALAASVRFALLATSSSLIGAWRPQGTAAYANRASGTTWLSHGESIRQAALEEPEARAPYARTTGMISEAVESSGPRLSSSPASPREETRLQGLPIAPSGLADLVVEEPALPIEGGAEPIPQPAAPTEGPVREPSGVESSPQTRFQTDLRGPLAEAYFPALLAAIAARVPLSGTRLRSSASEPREAATQSRAARGVAQEAPAPDAPLLPASGQRAQLSGETDFFGLESVAETLSLAAALHGASRLEGVVPPPPGRPAPRAREAPPREAAKAAPLEQAREPGQASRLLEGWRSAPEEAVARVLSEAPASPGQAQGAQPQEADDRELRRRIERLIEEDLRRHGYQP